MPNSIKLYSVPTPNCCKIPIFLELLGLKYDQHEIDILKNIHMEPWFIKINPNGKVPVLHDLSRGITVSETAVILLYFADKYDQDREFSYKHALRSTTCS